MRCTKIIPDAKTQDEKTMYIVATALPIVGGIIAPLVMYYGMNEKLSKPLKEVVLAMLNFQIAIVILSVAAMLIPFLGWSLIPIIPAINFVICLIATLGVLNNTEIKIPVFYEFVKPQENNNNQQNQ